MTILKDSSEVQKARELLLEIMAPPVAMRRAPALASQPGVAVPVLSLEPTTPIASAQTADDDVMVQYWVAVHESDAPAAEAPPAPAEGSRGSRLQDALLGLCTRAGLTGALITDSNGLAVAASGPQTAGENLAAFTTVLGDVLHKAGSYLGQDDASDVSLDINASQKVVLRRFALEDRPFYLLVLCAAASDPRPAMRDAIPEIVSVLAVS